jgi:chemotaxis family two-component system sensor kinase Cph1
VAPTVLAHEIRLVQLLQNLIGNAIKYRSAAPPEIHVCSKRRDGDWLFSEQDNGIGIEPEYAQQVFGIFKRLHGQSYPGTGIGLAICQRIGGKVRRAHLGGVPGGSRFVVLLYDSA